MKKVSRSSSSSRGVASPARATIRRRLKPRFGPDPAPQPIVGRWGRSAPSVRRRGNPVERRSGRGAAAPLRFVFVRRGSTSAKIRARSPVAPTSARPRSRTSTPSAARVPSKTRSRSEARQEPASVAPPSPPSLGSPESAPMPWVPPLMVAHLEPDPLPPGLPEIPPILLEGDGGAEDSPRSPFDRGGLAAGTTPSAVWLAGCDPRTLILGWEEASGTSVPVASPTEWRLKSAVEPDSVLAAGPLPSDRRFLFLQDPPAAPVHIAEIGVRSVHGEWECWASSGPVSLPPFSSGDSPGRENASAGDAGLRPGVASGFFDRLIDQWSSPVAAPGSSELALHSASRRAESGGAGEWAPSSQESLGISSAEGISSSAVGLSAAGSGGQDDFWFRVNAEVVIFGSAQPGARVTLSGRPITLRPDGSFTFRCALPDGRFELPMVAVSSRGSEARQATLTLARQTLTRGGVGSHPGTPGLPPPQAIP